MLLIMALSSVNDLRMLNSNSVRAGLRMTTVSDAPWPVNDSEFILLHGMDCECHFRLHAFEYV